MLSLTDSSQMSLICEPETVIYWGQLWYFEFDSQEFQGVFSLKWQVGSRWIFDHFWQLIIIFSLLLFKTLIHCFHSDVHIFHGNVGVMRIKARFVLSLEYLIWGDPILNFMFKNSALRVIVPKFIFQYTRYKIIVFSDSEFAIFQIQITEGVFAWFSSVEKLM